MQRVSGAGVNDVRKQGMLGFGRKPSPSAVPDTCLHTVAVSPIKNSSNVTNECHIMQITLYLIISVLTYPSVIS